MTGPIRLFHRFEGPGAPESDFAIGTRRAIVLAMKTHALRLAIFTFFTAIAFLIGYAAPANSKSSFFSDSLGMAGIASKGSGVYEELAERVYDEFKKTQAPFIVFNHGELPAAGFQEDFANFCMDGDSSDVVSWLTSGDSSRKISFSCVLDGELPRIRERLFVFTLRDGGLADVQVASADVLATGGASRSFRRDLPTEKPWISDNETDRVFIAISGAMISGGISASLKGGPFQAADLTSREAGTSALVSGLGAAVSHYVFKMAPASSGLAGGGLSLALADINDNVPDPVTGILRRRFDRKSDINGGLGPITLRLTFKFW